MFGDSSLDQTAREYLVVPAVERARLMAKLTDAGAKVVLPLLRVALEELKSTSINYLKPSLKDARNSTLGEEFAYHVWVETEKSLLTKIFALASAIGQPGMDALCRAMWERDDKMRMLAALVLLEDENPSPRTAQGIQDAFDVVVGDNLKKSYFTQGGMLFILSLLMARAGNEGHQKVLREFSAQKGISVTDATEMSRNTGLSYLLRESMRG